MSSSRSWTKEYYLGTQMPYYYSFEPELNPPPGYYPFYINYLGRHGGGYLANPQGAMKVLELLKEASKCQELTLRGLDLYDRMMHIMQSYSSHMGTLSAVGTRTIQEIAHRMYKRYPTVFGRRIDCVSTYKESAWQSLVVFLKELIQYIPKESIYSTKNKAYDPILNFWNDGIWKNQENSSIGIPSKREIIETLEPKGIANQIAHEIFGQKFLEGNQMSTRKIQLFVDELFDLVTQQFDRDGVISLSYYFTLKEKKSYWEKKNAMEYYSMGPGAMVNPMYCKRVLPLLQNFLTTSELAIQSGKMSANIRFAHASTIIPFTYLLGLSGCCAHTDSVQSVSQVWKDYEVACMASNVQWIFYRNKSNVLVQMKYNEKNKKFPVEAEFPGFYRWEVVKHYYEKIIEQT